MRNFRRTKLLAFLLTAILLLEVPGVFAAESTTATPTVREVAFVISDSSIRYPQLEGLTNADIQETINNLIVEKANITQRMVTLSTLKAGGTGLAVSYDAYLGGGIFSTVISAKGILDQGRNSHAYTALSFDLATGRELTLADLFTKPQEAVAYMEQTLQSTYLEELSNYLENSALTPLPIDSFTLDADGITFYYPYAQFALLSGYCGAAQFTYDELASFLLAGKGSLPERLNVLPQSLDDQTARDKIVQTMEAGELPHISVKLGDRMTDLISRYRLLREPDRYPGGRYCQFEAPAFRQVLVLTDTLTTGYEQSTVEGIMCFRGNLFGICIGETAIARWREILGEPESTVAFDEALAYDYGLPTGTADYYNLGGHQLMLYADSTDTLFAVRLTQ